VVSIIIFLFYPLNEKRMTEINGELARRRDASGNAPA
jgi:Na+/melibiose symporter-like transporter